MPKVLSSEKNSYYKFHSNRGDQKVSGIDLLNFNSSTKFAPNNKSFSHQNIKEQYISSKFLTPRADIQDYNKNFKRQDTPISINQSYLRNIAQEHPPGVSGFGRPPSNHKVPVNLARGRSMQQFYGSNA